MYSKSILLITLFFMSCCLFFVEAKKYKKVTKEQIQAIYDNEFTPNSLGCLTPPEGAKCVAPYGTGSLTKGM